jgi:hypothetical protein
VGRWSVPVRWPRPSPCGKGDPNLWVALRFGCCCGCMRSLVALCLQNVFLFAGACHVCSPAPRQATRQLGKIFCVMIRCVKPSCHSQGEPRLLTKHKKNAELSDASLRVHQRPG